MARCNEAKRADLLDYCSFCQDKHNRVDGYRLNNFSDRLDIDNPFYRDEVMQDTLESKNRPCYDCTHYVVSTDHCSNLKRTIEPHKLCNGYHSYTESKLSSPAGTVRR